jgi:hypothetical protein
MAAASALQNLDVVRLMRSPGAKLASWIWYRDLLIWFTIDWKKSLAEMFWKNGLDEMAIEICRSRRYPAICAKSPFGRLPFQRGWLGATARFEIVCYQKF